MLKRAVYEVLKSLSRIMLRCGLGHREFSDIYRRAYVDAGFFLARDRHSNSTAQAISLVTGLSRREIARYAGGIKDAERNTIVVRSPAARVLQEWFTAPEFLDEAKRPVLLRVDSIGGDSFEALIRRSAVDVPAGALLAVLTKAGAVIYKPDGSLQAVKRYFVPGELNERILEGLNFGLFNLVSAIETNTTQQDPSLRHFQREVHSARIPRDSVDLVRAYLENVVSRLSVELDDLLVDWQASLNCAENNGGAECSDLGVGLYYVDEDVPKEIVD